MKRLIPFLILFAIAIWGFNFIISSKQIIKETNNRTQEIKMKFEFEKK